MNLIKFLNLANIIRGHKNTATSVISLVLLGFLCFEWWTGKITFREFAEYCGMIATVAGIVIGFLAPDGKTVLAKDQDRKELIEKIKQQLQNKQDEENKIPVCNCGDANAGCRCMLPEADQ